MRLGIGVGIVTRCGVITQVLGAVQGHRPARWDIFRPQNTSLTVLRWSDAQAERVTFDVRCVTPAESKPPRNERASITSDPLGWSSTERRSEVNRRRWSEVKAASID